MSRSWNGRGRFSNNGQSGFARPLFDNYRSPQSPFEIRQNSYGFDQNSLDARQSSYRSRQSNVDIRPVAFKPFKLSAPPQNSSAFNINKNRILFPTNLIATNEINILLNPSWSVELNNDEPNNFSDDSSYLKKNRRTGYSKSKNLSTSIKNFETPISLNSYKNCSTFYTKKHFDDKPIAEKPPEVDLRKNSLQKSSIAGVNELSSFTLAENQLLNSLTKAEPQVESKTNELIDQDSSVYGMLHEMINFNQSSTEPKQRSAKENRLSLVETIPRRPFGKDFHGEVRQPLHHSAIEDAIVCLPNFSPQVEKESNKDCTGSNDKSDSLLSQFCEEIYEIFRTEESVHEFETEVNTDTFSVVSERTNSEITQFPNEDTTDCSSAEKIVLECSTPMSVLSTVGPMITTEKSTAQLSHFLSKCEKFSPVKNIVSTNSPSILVPDKDKKSSVSPEYSGLSQEDFRSLAIITQKFLEGITELNALIQRASLR